MAAGGLAAEAPVTDGAIKLDRHHPWTFQSDREFLEKKLGHQSKLECSSPFSPVRNSPTKKLIMCCDQNYIRRQKFVRSYTFKINASHRAKKLWIKAKQKVLKLKNNAENCHLSESKAQP